MEQNNALPNVLHTERLVLRFADPNSEVRLDPLAALTINTISRMSNRSRVTVARSSTSFMEMA